MPPKGRRGRPPLRPRASRGGVGADHREETSVNMEASAGPQAQHREDRVPHPPPPIADIATIAAVVNQVLQQQGFQPGRQATAPTTTAPGTKVHYKALKDMGLPTFDGGPDPLKAESWIEEAQRNMELLEVPEEVRVKVTVPFLVSEAAKWWKTKEATLGGLGEVIPWLRFREMFLAHYFPPAVRAQKMEEFYRLKQAETMTVVEYAHQFEALGQFAPVWENETTRMFHFKKGLNKEFREKVVIG